MMLKYIFRHQFKTKYLNYVIREINFNKTTLKNHFCTYLADHANKQPELKDFISKFQKSCVSSKLQSENIPYLDASLFKGDGQKVYIEVYGCQMNVNDADLVWAILQGAGYQKVTDIHDANIVLLISCAIREGAEQKIWSRLHSLSKLKKKSINSERRLHPKICLLGCMAERLKEKVLEIDKSVDLVAGPDSYKDLPRLLAITRSSHKAVNVLLSLDETYADIMPVQLDDEAVTSYVSIMRGCNNMCTFCIVPFTRGRERSRPLQSILKEVENLSKKGVKEVTLLGQNVNSFNDTSCVDPTGTVTKEMALSKGFKSVYKIPRMGLRFAELLDKVSSIDPEMRIRFTSPHPKDFPDEVLEVIKNKPNVCKSIHLPAQSGNDIILDKMRRGYTRKAYIELVDRIKSFVPSVTLSSDLILGFCGETEQQYQDTISLIKLVKFHKAFVYAYSMREKTSAHRKYEDDVPTLVKLKRVAEVMDIYRNIATELNRKQIDEKQLVLIEGNSKRSDMQLAGRNDGNIKVIIPKCDVPENNSSLNLKPIRAGDYICVQILDANSQVLKGQPLFHTNLQNFSSK